MARTGINNGAIRGFLYILMSSIRERHDAVFDDATDPDDAVLRVHSIGGIPEPVLLFTEILCDRDRSWLRNELLLTCMITPIERRSSTNEASSSTATTPATCFVASQRCAQDVGEPGFGVDVVANAP
jgi:hypothetical protein